MISEPDRRKFDVLHNVIIPVLVALLVGAGSSYITAQVAIAVLHERVESLQNDYVKFTAIAEAVSVNQIRGERFEEWRMMIDERIKYNLQHIQQINESRYTVNDSARDLALLRLEMQMIKEGSADSKAQPITH